MQNENVGGEGGGGRNLRPQTKDEDGAWGGEKGKWKGEKVRPRGDFLGWGPFFASTFGDSETLVRVKALGVCADMPTAHLIWVVFWLGRDFFVVFASSCAILCL